MDKLFDYLEPDFLFNDDRGMLVQLVRNGWNQVNYIYTKKGVIRGNHYHKFNTEAFFVISGKFNLELQSLDGDKRENVIMNKNKFFRIGPNVLHSFTFLEDTLLISMYDKGVEKTDGSKDIETLNSIF